MFDSENLSTLKRYRDISLLYFIIFPLNLDQTIKDM